MISIWTFLSLSLPLILFYFLLSSYIFARFSTPQEEQARGVVSVPPCLVFQAWIKVAFRAAIVRLIRKSYLQRVWVGGRRVSQEDGRRCGYVWSWMWVLASVDFFFFFFLSPCNPWNYTCHLSECVFKRTQSNPFLFVHVCPCTTADVL